MFRYRANNDNSELGFCFQSENLRHEKNSELSFFGIGQITITRNSELCFQSENLRHEQTSELSFFGIGQITITRNSDFAFKVKISDTRKTPSYRFSVQGK